MKSKMNEEEKITIGPKTIKKIKSPEYKKINVSAQNALKRIPNVKTDGLDDLLNWLEDYLKIFKK